MCISTQSLRDRLRTATLRHFGALIEDFFPEELREQFREIQSQLTKVPDTRNEGLYMSAIHSMTTREVRGLIDKIIVLREEVALAYFKR
jgi:hypothetical protein